MSTDGVDPDDIPFKQSRAGMTPRRWRALLRRFLAGEPVADLAREHGVSVSTIHHNAAKYRMRKKDHPTAVRLPKGPAPVTGARRDDGGARLACGGLVFDLDPAAPEATLEALADLAGGAAREGRDGDYLRALRMFEVTRRVFTGGRMGRSLRETAGALEDAMEEAGAPLILRTAQVPPPGDWSTWLFLGGRGAGKTLAGASWLADQAQALPGGRLALIGPTLHDVREVMIEGESGVRSLPRWTRADRPRFEATRRRLVFDNGCVAHAFSADAPERLRGPQFAGAWADEFCAWPGSPTRGAAEVLALLRMGLRLPGPVQASDSLLGRGQKAPPSRPDAACGAQAGSDRVASGSPPRLVVTTTPRPTRALIGLRDEASCIMTHAATAENAAHLSPRFLEGLKALYGGTRRVAQELEGKVVHLDGALFTAEMMMAARAPLPSPPAGEGGDRRSTDEGSHRRTPSEVGRARDWMALCDPSSDPLRGPPSPAGGEGKYDRIVVAIDPTATAGGAACGIVAAGRWRRGDGVACAVVLADRSVSGVGPDAWARRAVALAEEVGAHALVAEVNQGGDMVRAVLKTAGSRFRLHEVRATRGKTIRAEPVAALYEQGRIRHAGAFDALEEELMAFGGETEGAGTMDRADALVWAITHLLVDGPQGDARPWVRVV